MLNSRPSSRAIGLVVACFTFTAVVAGGTIPTPLYSTYSEQLALNPLMVTVLFGAYAVGTIGALIFFGRLSDQIGRRPLLAMAVTVAAVSSFLFAATPPLAGLIVARILSGLSVGLITSTATAYISELNNHGRRSSAVALLFNLGSLGLGALVSGIVTTAANDSTILPYLVHLVLLVPAATLLFAPETVEHPRFISVKPQSISVPGNIRKPFVAAAIAGFAAFSMMGVMTGTTSYILSRGLSIDSHLAVGVVSSMIFLSAAAIQLPSLKLDLFKATMGGLALLPIGLVLITVAIPTKALALLIAGVVVGGIGVGLAVKSSLTTVNKLAPGDRRSEINATFFLISYIGLTVPVIGTGLLITLSTVLVAAVAMSILVGVLTATSAGIILKLRMAEK